MAQKGVTKIEMVIIALLIIVIVVSGINAILYTTQLASISGKVGDILGIVGAPPEPIKIGGIMPLSGALALSGVQMKEAVQFVVDEVNEKGGLLGRPVEVFFQDDEGKPDTAVTATEYLITAEKVKCIIGFENSGNYLAAMETTADNGVLLFSCGVESTSISQKIVDDPGRYKYCWKSWPNNTVTAAAITASIKQFTSTGEFTPKTWKYGLILEDSDYGRYIGDVMTTYMTANGWTRAIEDFAPIGTSDFYTQIAQYKEAQLDLVIAAWTSDPSILGMTKQIHELGFKGAYACINSVYVPDFINLTGAASEYVLDTKLGFSKEPLEDLNAKIRAKFGHDATDTHALWVAGTRFLMYAIEQAGSLDNDKIADTLGKVAYYTDLLGFIIKLDPATHIPIVGYPYFSLPVAQVQNGAFQLVYPPSVVEKPFKMPPQ